MQSGHSVHVMYMWNAQSGKADELPEKEKT